MEIKCDRCGKMVDDNQQVRHGGKRFCSNACQLAYARYWYDPRREYTVELKAISQMETVSCPRCNGLGLVHNVGSDFQCRLCDGTGEVTPKEAWDFIQNAPGD